MALYGKYFEHMNSIAEQCEYNCEKMFNRSMINLRQELLWDRYIDYDIDCDHKFHPSAIPQYLD